MSQIQQVQTSQIIAGQNDRQKFHEGDLESLAASISEHGLAQPITVRPVVRCTCGRVDALAPVAPLHCDDCHNDELEELFEIVAGERRFRACSQIVRWETIPAIVKVLDDETASAIMLAENTGRTDLDPIEEAVAYQRRIDRFNWTESQVADRAGVTVIRVRFRLKMLNLRPEIQALVSSGDLLMGYAQILADAGLDKNRQMIALARLRQNSSPTPAWFRSEVNALLEQQAQDSLFDLMLVGGIPTVEEALEIELPPLPSTDTPPQISGYAGPDSMPTVSMVINSHITFWTEAAEDWDRLGKNFKRDQCQSAADALRVALQAVSL